MPLLLHRAPRADHLVEGLAALLGTPLADPFAKELVLVPARGIERWLSQQLSHRLGPRPGVGDGVCAGVEFRSPHSLVGELLGTQEEDPWAPDVLAWSVLAVLDECGTEPWARTLGVHLGLVPDDADDEEDLELRRGRRWSVARRLAGLFASYAVQRPSLLAEWEVGRATDGTGTDLPHDLLWQPELWRRVLATVGAPSPVTRNARTVARLREQPADFGLPERLSLFGHTRIPTSEVDLLAALGEHRDVHLWLPHPSAALWEALRDVRGVVARTEDDSHERVGHPLLAALGRDVRELQRALDPVVVDEPMAVPATPRDDLLGRLQRDIAANGTATGPRVLPEDDRSVQVHACHGPARQVEVLREVVLGLLADDPTLEPRDILVMCPDIEAYAPLVTAAFGLGAVTDDDVDRHHPGHRLRVTLADRNLTQTNPLFGVVGHLLDLAGGRAEASRVLDLLAHAAVRRRFGFSEKDLETVTTWVQEAGIRWGFDAEHRASVGLQAYAQNTWRHGLDRLLTGVAVSDDAGRFFGDTLPLDAVASTSIDLAGRLAECLDRLQRVTADLAGERPVRAWMEALTEGMDALTAVGRGDEWQVSQVHRELAGLGAGDGRTLRLSDVRALMADRVAGRPSRASFRTGTMTICTMTPMRSVPHRVVCLLGLDDGVFPRAGLVDGDDVLGRRPLTGERDPRSEDRQLLLDAVLAAQQTLVLTYTGQAETTGQPRPPAVPLQELLDALDDTVPGAARAVTRVHPLQAFASSNFTGARPFSFDHNALRAAEALTGDRPAPESLAALRLPPLADDVVQIDKLVAFFKSPVKGFLSQRLRISQVEEGTESCDAIPVELDGLQQWQVGDRLVRELLEGRSETDILAFERRRGELPPGRLGERLAATLARQARPIVEKVESLRAGHRGQAIDLDLPLGDGRHLVGTLSGVHGNRMVLSTFSRVGAKQWLDTWIPLLALAASGHGVREGWTVGKADGDRSPEGVTRVGFRSPEDPLAQLRTLVAVYDEGRRQPLPLPRETAFCFVDPDCDQDWKRRFDAERAWNWRESREPEHVRVWGEGFDYGRLRAIPGGHGVRSRFDKLVSLVWRPMAAARVAPQEQEAEGA